MNPKELQNQILSTIREYTLFTAGDRVLVAASGGVDSVVLFHILWTLREELKIDIFIVHVNHGLRGDKADRDQQFVESLGKDYDIPVFTKHVDVQSYVKETKCSIEEGARILRYHCFQKLLDDDRGSVVALGHHGTDQAETILDHFLRGAGPQGLAGMRWRNGPYVRPLLNIQRDKIETYAHQTGLNHITDDSNTDLRFKRNRIRHLLIPLLQEEFNPSIIDGLGRTAAIFQQVDDYFKHEAVAAYHNCVIYAQKDKIILDIHRFFHYFNIIQIYVLYYIVDVLSISDSPLPGWLQFQFLELIKKNKIGSKIQLTGNLKISVDHDGLVFYKPAYQAAAQPFVLDKWQRLDGSDISVHATQLNRGDAAPHITNDPSVEYVDADNISGEMILRGYRPGDRFKPLNCSGHQTVSNFYTDHKVPQHERPHIPLLLDDQGIIWIAGYRIDDRVKITGSSQQFIKLEMRKDQHD